MKPGPLAEVERKISESNKQDPARRRRGLIVNTALFVALSTLAYFEYGMNFVFGAAFGAAWWEAYRHVTARRY